MKDKSCKHEWELSHTDYQYSDGITNTDRCATEYAYFYCKKCLKVVKKEVEKYIC